MAEDAGEDLGSGVRGIGMGGLGLGLREEGREYHDDGDGEEDPVAGGCRVSCCLELEM